MSAANLLPVLALEIERLDNALKRCKRDLAKAREENKKLAQSLQSQTIKASKEAEEMSFEDKLLATLRGEIRNFALAEGKKIDAIKRFREMNYCSIKEAKDFVESVNWNCNDLSKKEFNIAFEKSANKKLFSE